MAETRHKDLDAIVPVPETRTLQSRTVEVRTYGGLTIAQRGKFHQLLAESLDLGNAGLSQTAEQSARAEYVDRELLKLILVDVDDEFLDSLPVAQVTALTLDFLEGFATIQRNAIGSMVGVLEQIAAEIP